MLLGSSARVVLVLLLCGFYLSCTMWMLYCLCCNLLLSRSWFCFPLDGVLVLSWMSIVWVLPAVGSLGLTLSPIVVWQIFGCWSVRDGFTDLSLLRKSQLFCICVICC
jgi:hypothetical protein